MISPTYPDVRDRDTFTVMQTCRLLGICRTSLKTYDEKGYLTPHYRADGRKVYTGKTLKDFYTRLSNF